MTTWRSQMERDAFAVAFPGEELQEGDVVTVFMSYDEETEPGGYSEWTFWSGSPSQFVIEVRWEREVRKYSEHNPKNYRGTEWVRNTAVFEKKEALRFWLELMKRGESGG